jgi:hypothetical protein
LKEKVAITCKAAEANPDVVVEILQRSQSMTDQKPVQNSVICNEEQTERMNSVIKQVHVMIQSTSKQNRNNIEDAVGLGERGKDNDDEKHRSNSDDSVEYGDSGDEMIDEERKRWKQQVRSVHTLLPQYQHSNSFTPYCNQNEQEKGRNLELNRSLDVPSPSNWRSSRERIICFSL